MALAIPGVTLGARLREDAVGVWHSAVAAERPCTVRALRDELVGRDDARLLFVEEARRIAGLPAAHFLAVERVELRGAQPWVLTEPIDGPTLEQRLGAGPLPLEEALALARRAASSFVLLAERRQLHAAPVPARLLETARGRVWLTFRDVRAADEASALKGRRTADARWLPPEADEGHAEPVRAGPWAAWAVGALLRAALGLGPPRDAGGGAVPLPAEAPPAVTPLLARLLEPAPRLRVPDAATALALLERGAAPPAGASGPGAGPAPARPRPPAPIPGRLRKDR